jgi:hypothetical protein
VVVKISFVMVKLESDKRKLKEPMEREDASLSPNSKATQFIDVTSSTDEQAIFFLKKNNNNLDDAISDFFDFNGTPESPSDSLSDDPDLHTAQINSFIKITSSTEQAALFFLKREHFDLNAAVLSFLTANNGTIPSTSDEVSDEAQEDCAGGRSGTFPSNEVQDSDSTSDEAQDDCAGDRRR